MNKYLNIQTKMKNKKIREPRDQERFQIKPELENQKNAEENLSTLGTDINVEELTGNKDKIAEFINKASSSPIKTQEKLESLGYEALPLGLFINFTDLINDNGDLHGGAASTFTAQYIKNFALDDPNYEVAIGEYEDGYTAYLKKKDA